MVTGNSTYFDLLEETLKDNNLLNKPAQIYNVDETGMAYEHRGSGNKAQTTVVSCVNAIGQAILIYNIKKCGANQKQHCKQAGTTKRFDIS